jgi:hypothetical protein
MSRRDDEEELEFLRFFYEQAGHVFGPADDDVYRGINKEYEKQGGVVPREYKRE